MGQLPQALGATMCCLELRRRWHRRCRRRCRVQEPCCLHLSAHPASLHAWLLQDDGGGDESKFDAFLGNDAGVLGATGVYDEEDREVRTVGLQSGGAVIHTFICRHLACLAAALAFLLRSCSCVRMLACSQKA